MSLRELVLRQGVHEGPTHGDRGAQRAERGERVAEDDHGGEDDDHALDGVAHRVRHGRNLGECEEGHLVVEVVEEPGEGGKLEDL